MQAADTVRELHDDLARKYRIHRRKIEDLWRSFTPAQRAAALKAGAKDGDVLKHRNDDSLGDVYKIIPELNLKDLAGASPDPLLNLLELRASTTLSDQYRGVVEGELGDHQFILHSMQTNNLRARKAFPFGVTMFFDAESYGRSYEARNAQDYAKFMAGPPMKLAWNAGLCVPQSTGSLILLRQQYILQALNLLIEDILQSSSTRSKAKRSKRSEPSLRTDLQGLSIVPKPRKLSSGEIESIASDRRSSVAEHMFLCRAEPVYLVHALNMWFFSRPELLADEKGRRLPAHTDKFISTSIFELVHDAIAGSTNWNYVTRLFQLLLDKPSMEKLQRNVILEEISSVCHLEYFRCQSLFKRQVQMGCGSKLFRRISGVYANGVAKTSMKIKPESLAETDQLLYCVLRICQPETTVTGALEWGTKLDELLEAHPHDQDRLSETEYAGFSDLMAVVLFNKAFATSFSPPPVKKKDQIYALKSKELGDEIDALKTELDLAQYVIPIDNLLEPGVASSALHALDEFIAEKTGMRIGLLSEDLIDSCIADVQVRCKQVQSEAQNKEAYATTAAIAANTLNSEQRIQQRRQKEKTRPAHPSPLDITAPDQVPEIPVAGPTEPIKVKKSSYDVFSTLFSRGYSRGSISWTAFEAAMADVGFSMAPRTGSIYTFTVPTHLKDQPPITFHRPHGSNIEGYKLLFFASRLKRVFGWNASSFVAA